MYWFVFACIVRITCIVGIACIGLYWHVLFVLHVLYVLHVLPCIGMYCLCCLYGDCIACMVRTDTYLLVLVCIGMY